MDEFSELLLKTTRDKVQAFNNISKKSIDLSRMKKSSRGDLRDDGLEDRNFWETKHDKKLIFHIFLNISSL